MDQCVRLGILCEPEEVAFDIWNVTANASRPGGQVSAEDATGAAPNPTLIGEAVDTSTSGLGRGKSQGRDS